MNRIPCALSLLAIVFALAVPAEAATPLSDVDRIAHCGWEAATAGLQTVNVFLHLARDAFNGVTGDVKCLLWKTLCLNDGLITNNLNQNGERTKACNAAFGGAGIVNYNPCYQFVHTPTVTYYVGDAQDSYGFIYKREGWDYPNWRMPVYSCDQRALIAGTAVWKDTNGYPGLQIVRTGFPGYTLEPDRLCRVDFSNCGP